MLKVDFFFVELPPLKPYRFAMKISLYFTTNMNMLLMPLLRCSDCEVNDVVEMAKDEKLTEKLYEETLRALKLDGI
jgi:hypothetical protein